MNRMRMVVLALVGVAVLAVGRPVAAQVCGDADGDGTLTDIDAVGVLRAAATLPSSCTDAVCDLDGDGVVTDVDGARALRAAAELPVELACPSTIRRIVTGVMTTDGEPGVYHVGGAPLPGGDAPSTVTNVSGSMQITPGGTTMVTVDYDTENPSAAAATDGNDLRLVIAIADPQVNLVDGFYEIPITAPAGQLTLDVSYAQDLALPSFIFCPATQTQGVLSNYGMLPQSAAP